MNMFTKKKSGINLLKLKTQKELILAVGDSGCVLFLYYLNGNNYDTFNITDDKANSENLGWPIRKVAKERLKLIKKGWLLYQIFSSPKGKVRSIHMGKEAVKRLLDSQKP